MFMASSVSGSLDSCLKSFTYILCYFGQLVSFLRKRCLSPTCCLFTMADIVYCILAPKVTPYWAAEGLTSASHGSLPVSWWSITVVLEMTDGDSGKFICCKDHFLQSHHKNGQYEYWCLQRFWKAGVGTIIKYTGHTSVPRISKAVVQFCLHIQRSENPFPPMIFHKYKYFASKGGGRHEKGLGSQGEGVRETTSNSWSILARIYKTCIPSLVMIHPTA